MMQLEPGMVELPMKFQDLHSHTKTSDGKLTYRQSLDVHRRFNVELVAFTDHDSVPDEKSLKIINNLRDHPTRWILGIEISSGLPQEMGGHPTSNFHITGLFIDPANLKLRRYCEKMQSARLERMELIVKNLRAFGFSISVKECLLQAAGETVNRPHIVTALLRKKRNLKTMDKLRAKMASDAKRNPEVKEKYDEMIRRGTSNYPYYLFLDPQAYFPSVYVDYLYGLDLDKTVDTIHGAGGLAFLAHWSFIKKKVDFQKVKDLVTDKRIDGLETIYNFNVVGRQEEIKEDMGWLEKLADETKCLKSGGADAHSETDVRLFYEDNVTARKTQGLVKPMLKLDVFRGWSTV